MDKIDKLKQSIMYWFRDSVDNHSIAFINYYYFQLLCLGV